MNQLTKELADAVGDADQLEVVDPTTGRVYVIMERSAYELEQGRSVREAIQEGYDSIATGEGVPLEEADAQMRRELGFPPRS